MKETRKQVSVWNENICKRDNAQATQCQNEYTDS